MLLILNRLQEEAYVGTPSAINDGYTVTLLQKAIKYDHSQEVLEKLVEMGATINPTKRNLSPLLFAQKHKKQQAADWLIKQGAVIPPKKKWFSFT